MNVLLFCDDRGYIRYYTIGWPGTLYDNTIFEKTEICKNPAKFFSPGQFTLADGGFAIKMYCIPPYRNPAAEIPENRFFNFYFSSARAKIEHVNGILKNRFSSLRGIRTQVKKKEDFALLNKHVLVCLILHNILIRLKDEWDDEDDDDDDDDDVEEEAARNVEQGLNARNGIERRIEIQNSLINWARERTV